VASEQISATASSARKHTLLRILGVAFGLAVAIGGTIGVGILRVPGIVAAQVGTSGLIVAIWIFGGLYCFAGANSYAELGTMLPLAGGPYVYARRAYGDFGGFLIGWSDWLLRTSSMAYLAVALIEYSPPLLSASGATTLLAIVALIAFTALHWLGLRVGSRTQEVMSLFKVIAFFVIIASCFFFSKSQNPPAAPTLSLPCNPMLLFAGVTLALQNVLETYSGWHSPVYFAEEDTDPARTIPRSLFSGVFLVMAIYVLFNLAMLHALPLSKLAGSKLAAGDAAQAIFGGYAGQIITTIALISVLGIVNASFLFTPRVLYALSRDGLFSAAGATVNAKGTPTGALLVTVCVAIGLTTIGTFEKLFLLSGFLAVTVDGATFAALFVLRRREPNLSRPFKARGYPLLPAIVLAGAILLLIAFVISNTFNSLCALGGMALSYPVYLLIKRRVSH
jgi:APA family basic amino acid/polyamine antiporter